MKRGNRRILKILAIVIAVYLLPVGFQFGLYYFGENRNKSWYSLSTDSSEQAPDPGMTDDAIIQVYAARTVRWRGVLGVHTWIATKRSDEDFYTRMEVMGYALRWSGQAVQIRRGRPDSYWYGNKPELLREIRGDSKVDAMIDRLQTAAAEYPYNHHYKVWPGPNSNTFLAYLGRKVTELNLELPSTAVGKDYLPDRAIFEKTPSGEGVQFSLNGAFGVTLGLEEGIEMNIAGLTAGLDFSPIAIKLPAVGRLGVSDLQRITIR